MYESPKPTGVSRTFNSFNASGTCAFGIYIDGPGSRFSAPSRTSPTIPTICRGVSEASSDMMPLPIQILSFSGSPLGQNRFAIAWLMSTAGAPAALSCSLNVRPRSTGILKTSKYPGETVFHPPPP